MLQNISPQIRYTADAGAAGIAWLHFLGFWKDNVGTVAATLSVIWLVIQIYVFVKERFK